LFYPPDGHSEEYGLIPYGLSNNTNILSNLIRSNYSKILCNTI
jgi:hypothetical protein